MMAVTSQRLLLALGVAIGVGRLAMGCGPPALPPGPPPEYERPEVEAWDAAPPPNPFDMAVADADWVEDEPSGEADAGAPDAGEAEAGATDATEPEDGGDAGAGDAAGDADRDATGAPAEPHESKSAPGQNAEKGSTQAPRAAPK